MTEEFIEEADKVLYRRTMSSIHNKEVTVELYLTKNYITETDKETVQKYLNNAVAAILTRGGVPADAN